MAGTRIGGIKASQINKKKYGDDFYRRIGSMGGKKSTTGGTYGRPEWASKIGSIGGSRSKRGYKLIKVTDNQLHYIDKVTNRVVIFEDGRTLENHNRSPKIQGI